MSIVILTLILSYHCTLPRYSVLNVCNAAKAEGNVFKFYSTHRVTPTKLWIFQY